MSRLIPILLIFFCLSFLFRNDYSFDQDLGRHIKLGEIIVKTGSVPKVNLFSYTNPDFPFINTHWLFEVIAYTFKQTIGLNWLLYLKIVVILTSVGLTMATVNRKYYPLLLPIGFVFLHVLRERLDLRPEIFSFLFTAITIFILKNFINLKQTSHDRGTFVTKAIFLLPFIQLIWINTHIYFFVGLVIQAIFLISLGYQYLRFHLEGGKLKLMGIIFMLSVGLSFVNPNGLTVFLYPLNVQNNYGYTIVENQTMFLLESIGFSDRNFLFVKISLAIVALSFFVAYKRKPLNLPNLLLPLFAATLALLNVRSFPYLIFIGFPSVMENFGPIRPGSFTKMLTILTAFLLMTESFLYLNGSYYKYSDSPTEVNLSLPESGKGALDFVLTNNLPSLVYNNFDIGSYIIYKGYPKYRVFVDGRPEGYPTNFLQEDYIATQSDFQKFKKQEDRLGFKTIIFSHTDQTPWGKSFLNSLSHDSNWNLVYLDDFMVVYLKKEIASKKGLKTIDLSSIEANYFNFKNHLSYLRIAFFLINSQYISQASPFIDKALEIFPQSPIANKIKAQMLSSGGVLNYSLAQDYLQRSNNFVFW